MSHYCFQVQSPGKIIQDHLGRASLEFCVKVGSLMSCRLSAFTPAATFTPVAVAAFLMIQSLSAQTAGPSNPAAQSVQQPATTPAAVASPAPSAPSLLTTNAPAMGMQKPQEATVPNGERSSYSSVHVDGPYIAMTFDDGPHATLTPKLLDILKERHIHVTFFVLGQCVKEHPEILQREIAEGHEVANHTWDHLPLPKVVSKEGGLNHEIADTSTLIKEVSGKPPVLLRPPYGAMNPRLARAIEQQYGLKVILWSVDPDDWKDPGASVVESRILNGWKESGGAKSGAIILSHDIHKGTVEAMPATLDALLAKGYKFVTVSELLAMEKAPTPTPAKQP
jgi:peptidoglycan-N-acetylglucosamine deacetylase